jgi:predicted DCC family thiol-disulfide oxidoreductase YuxK
MLRGLFFGVPMDTQGKYEIFLDGSCPFCQWTRARVEPYDANRRLEFLDYSDPIIAARSPFSRESLDKEMHVLTPAGTWLSGYEAWMALLRAMPKLAWLGWVLSAPPIRWVGPGFYRWVAKNRYHLPGSPPRCETDRCAPTARPNAT